MHWTLQTVLCTRHTAHCIALHTAHCNTIHTTHCNAFCSVLDTGVTKSFCRLDISYFKVKSSSRILVREKTLSHTVFLSPRYLLGMCLHGFAWTRITSNILNVDLFTELVKATLWRFECGTYSLKYMVELTNSATLLLFIIFIR